MTPRTPYSDDLGSREPIAAMHETTARIGSLVDGWTAVQFERTYAPGKWTARQILIHLAQTELAFGNRARMALSTPNYTAQAFDQDRWMARDTTVDGPAAVAMLTAGNAMNRALFGALTPSERATSFSHPEYGTLTVDWLIHQMAGHLVHHLKQLEEIATR